MGILASIINSLIKDKVYNEEQIDRYELFKMNRDDLRKVLTRYRAEEKYTVQALDEVGLESNFTMSYAFRPTRREATKTKERLVNEIMRIHSSLLEVGPRGQKLIEADQRLAEWFDRRGVENTLQTRRKFGRFMDSFRNSVLARIPPSDEVVRYFKEFGEDANIANFIDYYTRMGDDASYDDYIDKYHTERD